MHRVIDMGDVAYISNRGFGGAGGRKHLLHVYREKTEIENPKPPKFYGDKEYFDKLVDRNLTPPLKRNAKRDYFEFMMYAQTDKQIEEVRNLIAARLKIDKRRILAVYHEDEGTPHTHFLIAWRDPETRKSLRMTAGDIDYIRREGARIIGRVLERRKKREVEETKGVKYMWVDKKLCKAISRMDGKVKKKEKEAYTQIKKIVQMYGVVDVYLLRRNVGRLLCCSLFVHADLIKIAVYNEKGELSRFDNFKYSVLRYMNVRKHNEITFAPSRYVVKYESFVHTPNAIGFVDDVPEEFLTQLPKDSLIVETSPHSYQVHFPLEPYGLKGVKVMGRDGIYEDPRDVLRARMFYKPYPTVSVGQIFSGLVSYYRGDRGSRDYYHLRKLPGFLNLKYEDAPPVKIRDDIEKEKAMNTFGLAYYIGEKVHRENVERLNHYLVVPEKQVQKRWIDFYKTAPFKADGSRDLSVVDMKYTVYLLSHGIHPKSVIKALRQESWDITIRKEGHLDDYLRRTVEKGIAYVEQKGLQVAREEEKMREIGNIKEPEWEIEMGG